MSFGSEPTNAGDQEAYYLRRWYELNRESWNDRHGFSVDRSGVHADNFMLRLLGEVYRIQGARRDEEAKRAKEKLSG